MEALPAQTIRGGGYFAARYGLGVLVSLGNMLVMTRWIGPHRYGLFVTAVGLAAFLASFARAGLDTYLVRQERIPETRAYDVAATLILGISAGVVILGAASAPLLVRWYGSREFLLPYLALLFTVPLTALTGIPMAKLERELDFRRVAGVELGGQSLGLLVAATLAWLGCGVWAPVAGQIAWQSLVMGMSFSLAGLRPRLTFDRGQAREMLHYGAGITASLRIWQLRTLVNPLLVGRFAGAEGVAYVALAVRIAESLGTFRLAAGRMAIAALSRLQGREEKFRAALDQALHLQVMSLGPLLCGFGFLGPFIFKHVIGARWMPSLAVYPFVAAGVLVNSVYNVQASALFVMGQQWVVMRSYVTHVALLALGTLILLPRFGIIGYGWAELLACAAYFQIHVRLAERVEVGYRTLGAGVAVCLGLLFLTAVKGGFTAGTMSSGAALSAITLGAAILGFALLAAPLLWRPVIVTASGDGSPAPGRLRIPGGSEGEP
jgi:PST family polysaccharide transporter